MKVWILQNQMRTEKQMRAAALRHRIFFFLALLGPGSHKPLSYSLGVLKFFVGMSAAWSVETGPKRRFKKLILFFFSKLFWGFWTNLGKI